MKVGIVGACLIVCTGAAIFILWCREREIAGYSVRLESGISANKRWAVALRAEHVVPTSRIPVPEKPVTVAPKTLAPTMSRGHLVRERLLRTPEYAPFLRKEHQQRAMAQYGEWFAQLNVAPERLPVIKQAIADRIAISQDTFEAAVAAGYDMNSPEFGDMVARFEKEGDARLQQVLTADEFARYKGYEEVKWFATGDLPVIRANLEERGATPLSADQVASLSHAWQRASKWNPEVETKPGALARARHEKVLEYIGSALDPDQQAAVADYLQYLNLKGRRLGQLRRPMDPDGVAHSSIVGGK